jgi:hypothetical protein
VKTCPAQEFERPIARQISKAVEGKVKLEQRAGRNAGL